MSTNQGTDSHLILTHFQPILQKLPHPILTIKMSFLPLYLKSFQIYFCINNFFSKVIIFTQVKETCFLMIKRRKFYGKENASFSDRGPLNHPLQVHSSSSNFDIKQH